jgi:FAD/FMN-containing dehydrogenase
MNTTRNSQELANLFEGVEAVTQSDRLSKLSEDYFHFSPILTPLLEGKHGDICLLPENEEQILAIAKICVRQRIPITVRGSGTGNYGQCVPLQGGVILDMSKLQKIHWLKPGLVCCEPGVKMAAIDRQAQAIGWELRMVPSTVRTATIGGFIAGGSGGIGSILYGQLRDRGNLRAVRVVSLEDQPKIIELRGDEVQKVNHAYGTNGIITRLELPLGSAYAWAELVVAFSDFRVACEFGEALGNSDGIIKKMISIHHDPIPTFFAAIRSAIPNKSHCVLVLVQESDLEPFYSLVQEYRGEIYYQKSAEEAKKGASLVEYSWNHTTLHARNADSNWTYLQSLFPSLDSVQELKDYFGEEIAIHLELIRMNGKVVPAAIQLVRFTTPERMTEIIKIHEERGVAIANPHTYILEDGGMKAINYQQLEFKRQVDPYGLMNPGKMSI